MKIPVKDLLEFRINYQYLLQKITAFMTSGLSGRIYWYIALPFHRLFLMEMSGKIAG
jgi:hypothetical protein